MTHAPPRVPIARFQLRIDEGRVRAVPATDLSGAPFTGAGVDFVGAAARDLVAGSAAIAAWFDAREPGVRLRSIAVDLATGRVLASLAGDPRPRALRIEPGDAEAIVDAAAPIVTRLEALVADRLAARARAT